MPPVKAQGVLVLTQQAVDVFARGLAAAERQVQMRIDQPPALNVRCACLSMKPGSRLRRSNREYWRGCCSARRSQPRVRSQVASLLALRLDLPLTRVRHTT